MVLIEKSLWCQSKFYKSLGLPYFLISRTTHAFIDFVYSNHFFYLVGFAILMFLKILNSNGYFNSFTHL